MHDDIYYATISYAYVYVLSAVFEQCAERNCRYRLQCCSVCCSVAFLTDLMCRTHLIYTTCCMSVSVSVRMYSCNVRICVSDSPCCVLSLVSDVVTIRVRDIVRVLNSCISDVRLISLQLQPCVNDVNDACNVDVSLLSLYICIICALIVWNNVYVLMCYTHPDDM